MQPKRGVRSTVLVHSATTEINNFKLCIILHHFLIFLIEHFPIEIKLYMISFLPDSVVELLFNFSRQFGKQSHETGNCSLSIFRFNHLSLRRF